uniref:Retinoic acid receptor responder protein 2 n=1 Tax=Marmota marmota marmota TaxID=9994 RepID=A0A8C6EQ40_MARMA
EEPWLAGELKTTHPLSRARATEVTPCGSCLSRWPCGWTQWAWAGPSSQGCSAGPYRWPWRSSTSTHLCSGPSRRLAWTALWTRLVAWPWSGREVDGCTSGGPAHSQEAFQRKATSLGHIQEPCCPLSYPLSFLSVCPQPFPAGTFVRLEFKLQQTNCRKKDWKKPECKVKPSGRKRKCLACIKLNSEDKVLGRMVHCPIHAPGRQEPQEHQETQCSRVERAGEDPHSYYFPGQFAFIKALPPS